MKPTILTPTAKPSERSEGLTLPRKEGDLPNGKTKTHTPRADRRTPHKGLLRSHCSLYHKVLL